MYRILTEQRKAAKKLGVVIRPSTLKNKKIDVYKNGFKVASVGDIRYNDYWIYKRLEKQGKVEPGTANDRRQLYKIRHGQECQAKGTPGFYACNILW
jgi:hypothetical protein